MVRCADTTTRRSLGNRDFAALSIRRVCVGVGRGLGEIGQWGVEIGRGRVEGIACRVEVERGSVEVDGGHDGASGKVGEADQEDGEIGGWGEGESRATRRRGDARMGRM